MSFNARTTIALLLLTVGCGSPLKKAKAPDSTNNTVTNNTTGELHCGNGALDDGELCDPGVEDSCPDTCDAPACSTAQLVGSPDDCTAECVVVAIACGDGDGCCPTGCDSSTDNDCTNLCGDGSVDAPELCDGDCPATCATADACTIGTLTGTAAACDATCGYTEVTECASGDGCCPAGCGAATDNDCVPQPVCGDGNIDDGELCDSNCPSACNDQVACTTDTMLGSAATCDAQCSNTPITSCLNNDGCCAPGCSFDNDNDCACVPDTCASVGAQCGTINDGCGSTVNCANSCSSLEVCDQNRCVEENLVGDDCSSGNDCGSSPDAACVVASDWPGGYCTLLCDSTADCPTGTHCGSLDALSDICMLNCTSSAQCKAGYECGQFDGVGGLECAPPAPVGDGVIGDTCANNDDCGSGLSCYTSAPRSEGGTATFTGGLCTKVCAVGSTQCGSGNVCTRDGLCTTSCFNGDDCRPNWQCQFNAQVLDNHCWPP